jgi:hypothetical protein
MAGLSRLGRRLYRLDSRETTQAGSAAADPQLTAPGAVRVSGLDFIGFDYDQETKTWFTCLATQQPLQGIVAGGDDPGLNADMTPVLAAGPVKVDVYKISVEIAPPANQAYAIVFANSSNKPAVKSWGLVVGTLAAAALPQVDG